MSVQARPGGGIAIKKVCLLHKVIKQKKNVPEQELWRAVPSSGHIFGVIGIGPLREITCKAWQEKTEESDIL